MKNNGKKNGSKKSHLELISEGLDKFRLNLADLEASFRGRVIPERKRDADHQYEKAPRIVEQAVKGNKKATEALHDLDSAVGSMPQSGK